MRRDKREQADDRVRRARVEARAARDCAGRSARPNVTARIMRIPKMAQIIPKQQQKTHIGLGKDRVQHYGP